MKITNSIPQQTDDFATQDYLLFGTVYSATGRTEAAPHDSLTSCELVTCDFALKSQPATYIITLQVRQFYKLHEHLVTRHMGNLEMTYGAEKVEEVVKMFFPNFAARYYGVE